MQNTFCNNTVLHFSANEIFNMESLKMVNSPTNHMITPQPFCPVRIELRQSINGAADWTVHIRVREVTTSDMI